MIWKLLRKNISPTQILGYALANVVGLAIVLAAVQFYSDSSAALRGSADGDSQLISNDYLVISRPVSLMNTLGGRRSGISAADIQRLADQPWAETVGSFEAANFPVSASVEFQGRGMSTHMFLEAIPDRFIDISPAEWGFDPAQGAEAEVPIIVAKDYLALYNFGFAATRGLPQLSEDLISQVPLTLYMRGNGFNDRFRARIVGFSSRLNTIAVPQDFMDWANARYSSDPQPDPSRLIVEVNNPGDPAVDKYLKTNGFEVAGDRLDNSRATFFLRLVTGIVATIGVIISALALFISLLSISLLLQKNRDKIALLSLLGYKRTQISACYIKLVGVVNCAVLVLALVACYGASHLWQDALAQIDIMPSSPLPAVLIGVAIMAVITLINVLTIARLVRRSAR